MFLVKNARDCVSYQIIQNACFREKWQYGASQRFREVPKVINHVIYSFGEYLKNANHLI